MANIDNLKKLAQEAAQSDFLWELGMRMPSAHQARKVCDILSLDLADEKRVKAVLRLRENDSQALHEIRDDAAPASITRILYSAIVTCGVFIFWQRWFFVRVLFIIIYMTEIIPAIIAKNFSELKEKIEVVEPYVTWVQLDIMDGKFVPNVSWNNPEDLASFPTQNQEGLNFEAHLMIEEPEKQVGKWIDAGMKRIIFHIEAISKPGEIIKICKDRGVEVGVAINLETPVENLTGIVPGKFIDMVLVLGVTPGFGGQEFKPEVIRTHLKNGIMADLYHYTI